MLTWDSIEQGLERFLDLLRADRRVQAEFEHSRGEFFVDAVAARTTTAELRHLEWFLLERPSTALGATPVQAWQEAWRASTPTGGGELAASFLHSIPGAFEVTSLVPGEGLWVRDLFTLGEHPVIEARAMSSLEVGDLLVGRLFPAGAGSFLLSPSVSVFRNPGLLAAVRADLEGMRAVRRGVLRVQQLELERIFHGSGGGRDEARATEEVAARAGAQLVELGLRPEAVAELVERVRAAARASQGQVVTDILNGLAFETGVDLARVRLVLVELWDVVRQTHLARSAPAPELAAETSPSRTRTALAAFDRGRAEGKDLEQLFRDLERDLGIEGESGEEEPGEDEGAPDFPGVIGAIVEEFLWEVERERGAEQARRWGVLRRLGDYGRDIGVFEEFGPTRLLDFSTRWLLDESGIRHSEEVEALMEALASFCQWCEERHDLPLWRQFGSTLDSLRRSVPRLLLLRQDGPAGGIGPFHVMHVGEQQALVTDGEGREREVQLNPHQAAHLRDGDLVRLVIEEGKATLASAYPRELAAGFPGTA
jgi:hypothetical protein